jgi:hypothetical protein
MRRPPRPPAPSAIAGYQRLRRGSPASNDLLPDDAIGVPGSSVAHAHPRRSRIHRVAGGARLAGLITVLAIIVGASVGLASSDQTHPRHIERAATATAVSSKALIGPKLRASSATKASTTKAVAIPKRPVAIAPKLVPPPTVVAAVTTATVKPTTALPFTGDRTPAVVLLGGGILVLIGMLLQIAGQPLPVRSIGR